MSNRDMMSWCVLLLLTMSRKLVRRVSGSLTSFYGVLWVFSWLEGRLWSLQSSTLLSWFDGAVCVVIGSCSCFLG